VHLSDDVAQICNLLYPRIASGNAFELASRCELAKPGGLRVRDTAEYNSTLLCLRLCSFASTLRSAATEDGYCYGGRVFALIFPLLMMRPVEHTRAGRINRDGHLRVVR
jgi:hypothetical protein